MPNEDRLNRAEERIAWLERHVLEQDKAMLELMEEISRLKKAVQALRERTSGGDGEPGGEAPAQERPPHY